MNWRKRWSWLKQLFFENWRLVLLIALFVVHIICNQYFNESVSYVTISLIIIGLFVQTKHFFDTAREKVNFAMAERFAGKNTFIISLIRKNWVALGISRGVAFTIALFIILLLSFGLTASFLLATIAIMLLKQSLFLAMATLLLSALTAYVALRFASLTPPLFIIEAFVTATAFNQLHHSEGNIEEQLHLCIDSVRRLSRSVLLNGEESRYQVKLLHVFLVKFMDMPSISIAEKKKIFLRLQPIMVGRKYRQIIYEINAINDDLRKNHSADYAVLSKYLDKRWLNKEFDLFEFLISYVGKKNKFGKLSESLFNTTIKGEVALVILLIIIVSVILLVTGNAEQLATILLSLVSNLLGIS